MTDQPVTANDAVRESSMLTAGVLAADGMDEVLVFLSGLSARESMVLNVALLGLLDAAFADHPPKFRAAVLRAHQEMSIAADPIGLMDAAKAQWAATDG